MLKLRSGLQTLYGPYDLRYYKLLLSGEYPNFSELKQIQNFIEDKFVIKPSQLTCRIEIIAFLHAQWKIYHENIIKTSTPEFKITYDLICTFHF
jgi:hypothetical protein